MILHPMCMASPSGGAVVVVIVVHLKAELFAALRTSTGISCSSGAEAGDQEGKHHCNPEQTGVMAAVHN